MSYTQFYCTLSSKLVLLVVIIETALKDNALIPALETNWYLTLGSLYCDLSDWESAKLWLLKGCDAATESVVSCFYNC